MEAGLCPYDVGLASLLVAALRQDPQRDPVDPALNDVAFGLGKFLHGEVESLWTSQERTIACLAGRVEVCRLLFSRHMNGFDCVVHAAFFQCGRV